MSSVRYLLAGIAVFVIAGMGSACDRPGNEPVCASGWCVIQPAGSSSELNSMWGSGPSDVWAVGAGGTALHWDGERWTQVPTGTSQRLRSVWGVAPDAVWAVGDQDTLLHWNGIAWSEFARPRLSGYDYAAITGSSPDNLWLAAADSRSTFRWNGTGWSAGPGVPIFAQTYASILAMWSVNPTSVWGVGTERMIIWGDGSDWSLVGAHSPLIPDGYRAVWGASPEEVWIAGDGLIHWTRSDGFAGSFSPWESDWRGLSGTQASDIWVVGGQDVGHRDGSAWEFAQIELPISLNAVWTVGPGEAWAVGADGVILHHAP